jgi:host factor-I protein
MQSFFEQRAPRLDTSSPSVRHLQELIRSRGQVHVEMSSGQTITGRIKWQDNHFIALESDPSEPLVLLNRELVALLRGIG